MNHLIMTLGVIVKSTAYRRPNSKKISTFSGLGFGQDRQLEDSRIVISPATSKPAVVAIEDKTVFSPSWRLTFSVACRLSFIFPSMRPKIGERNSADFPRTAVMSK